MGHMARPARRSVPSDPVLDAIDRAPTVRALTPEQRAELDQDLADIAAGRVTLTAHADVPRALEEMSDEQ
jgi:hypothetical protein